MVRLKDTRQIILNRLQQFQFQYGAIKSSRNLTSIMQLSEFQFQYGAIKSPKPPKRTR